MRYLLAFVLLPIVSCVASYLNAHNFLLALFFLLGSCVFAVFSRLDTRLRDHLYPLLLTCVTLSLVLSATAISSNLHGWDIQQEFSLFTQVFESGTWDANTNVLYNSALSISILPSILSIVSRLEGITIFMFVMPMVFSIVPAVLYKIYRMILAPDGAFLAVFLFMSYPSSYQEITELGRQEIAEVILVLLLWLIVAGYTRIGGRLGLQPVLLLTFGLVVSHYSLAYIYTFVLASSILLARFSRRAHGLVTLGASLLTAVIALTWYLVVAGGASFNSLGVFASYVVKGLLHDFLNPSTRPDIFLQAIGAKSALPGLLHDLNRMVQSTVILVLLFGFIVFLFRGQKKTEEKVAFPIIVTGVILLVSAAVLPFFAGGFNLSRFFHVSLLFASPCIVYGFSGLEQVLNRVRSLTHRESALSPHCSRGFRLSATTIVLLYFLFTSGWFWAVSMDRPTSLILDRERMLSYPDPMLRIEYYDGYTPLQDITAARFVRAHLRDSASLCAETRSRHQVLVSVGGVPEIGPELPSDCEFSTSYVYLSTLNSRYGEGLSWQGTPWYVSEFASNLAAKNRIYSDGGAILYE